MSKLKPTVKTLGNIPIMFGSEDCGACVAQKKLLNDYFREKGIKINVKYYNLKTKKAPQFLLDRNGSYSMPTWWLPKSGKIKKGIIQPKQLLRELPKSSKFGSFVPQIGTLAKYGKNFEDGKGFSITNSFNQATKAVWDNPLDSGTLGREFGPGNVGKIYENNYFNNIRMAHPAGDLATALANNRNCNTVNNNELSGTSKNLGIVFDSKNRQINSNSFGYRNLYPQMGPAFEKNSQYLISKNTVKNLYGGALQGEDPKPTGIRNNTIYIGTKPDYTPLKEGNLKIPKYKNNYGNKKTSTKY
jgi:hypothetical protein